MMVKKKKQRVSKKFIPQASLVSDELYLPNHSGQLDAGTFKLTDGSVLFSLNGKITQDNSNLFWDDVNKRLGIGRNNPESTLMIEVTDGDETKSIFTTDRVEETGLIIGPYGFDAVSVDFTTGNFVDWDGNIYINDYSSGDIYLAGGGGTTRVQGDLNVGSGKLSVNTTSGDVGIGITNPGKLLEVDGDAGYVDATDMGVTDADFASKKYVDDKKVESFPTSLTAGSVVFSDGSNLTQDNFNLYWDDAINQLEPNLIKITSDGTQAAPALKFNDTNTGFYKLGDSIRLSLNNSTKMTIDSTGVGIGTTSPDVGLHLGTNATGHSVSGATDAIISGKLEVDDLLFVDNKSKFYHEMQIVRSAERATHTFYAGSDQAPTYGLDAQTKQLNFTYSEFVARAFDHGNQTDPTIFIHSATDPNTANDEWISFHHDKTNGVFGLGSGAYTFPDGNVGIGTASPAEPLHIYVEGDTSEMKIEAGTTAKATQVALTNAVDGWDWIFGTTTTGLFKIRDRIAGTNIVLVEESAPTNSLYIDSSGQIGLGVSDPHSKLEVAGAISSATATITASSDTTDVSGINTLFIDITGDIVLGGLLGGVNGQVLNIVILGNFTNHVTLEHAEGIADTQDFINHTGVDELISHGGAIYVCNGTAWYDASHARHV